MEAEAPLKARARKHHVVVHHAFELVVAALLLGIAVVKYRHGPLPVEGVDLIMPYVCTRAWLNGLDPYDMDLVVRLFHDAGGAGVQGFEPKYFPPIYPPITFIVMAPLAVLPWETALRIWTLGAPVMVMLLAGSLLRLAGLAWNDPRAWLFLLFCIVFAPLRSAVTLGQNALPAVTLAVLAAAVVQRRQAVAGVLLAAAIAFKLQDALFVLLYFALTRHWRAVAWCIGGLAVMSIVAIGLPMNHPRWIFGVLHWIRDGSQTGSIIDPSPANGARFQMIHLPVLLYTVLKSAGLISILNGIICASLAGLAIAWIARHRPARPPGGPDLLSLAALGVISLLPFYHRFPDAMLLLLPMTWAVAQLRGPGIWQGRLVLTLLLLFLVQPSDITRSLVNGGTISRETYTSPWFQFAFRASAVWVNLVLACSLLVLQYRRKADIPATRGL